MVRTVQQIRPSRVSTIVGHIDSARISSRKAGLDAFERSQESPTSDLSLLARLDTSHKSSNSLLSFVRITLSKPNVSTQHRNISQPLVKEQTTTTTPTNPHHHDDHQTNSSTSTKPPINIDMTTPSSTQHQVSDSENTPSPTPTPPTTTTTTTTTTTPTPPTIPTLTAAQREAKLEKNRKAAQRCRQRKQTHQTSLVANLNQAQSKLEVLNGELLHLCQVHLVALSTIASTHPDPLLRSNAIGDMLLAYEAQMRRTPNAKLESLSQDGRPWTLAIDDLQMQLQSFIDFVPDVSGLETATLETAILETAGMSVDMETAIPMNMETAIPMNMETAIPMNMETAIPMNMETAIPMNMEAGMSMNMVEDPSFDLLDL